MKTHFYSQQIYLSTVAKGIDTFTQAQRATLEGIIWQCPLAGGRSVYIARSLYALINPTLVYDDIALCSQQNVSWRTGNSNTTETSNEVANSYMVYPNPANNLVNLQLSHALEAEGKFILFDVLGKVVKTYSVSEKGAHFTFSVSDINAGVYYYKLTKAANAISTGKIIITH